MARYREAAVRTAGGDFAHPILNFRVGTMISSDHADNFSRVDEDSGEAAAEEL
jgi:hypothetical protein